MATPSKKPKYEHHRIRLNLIDGIHKDLRKILNNSHHKLFSLPENSPSMKVAVLSLLEVMPIHIVPHKGGPYQAVSGLRSLALAKHILAPNEMVPVLRLKGRLNHEEMMRQFTIESIFTPLLLGETDAQAHWKQIKEMEEHLPDGIVDELKFKSRNHLAQLLNISLRTLEGFK